VALLKGYINLERKTSFHRKVRKLLSIMREDLKMELFSIDLQIEESLLSSILGLAK
jgi:hypothetical protein